MQYGIACANWSVRATALVMLIATAENHVAAAEQKAPFPNWDVFQSLMKIERVSYVAQEGEVGDQADESTLLPEPSMESAPPQAADEPLQVPKQLDQLTVDITSSRGPGKLPEDVAAQALAAEKTDIEAVRDWAISDFRWEAPIVAHKPLYFEEFALERYGQTRSPLLQPAISGAHFFGSVLILPYKMGLERPHELVYSLGHYRPGDCVPHLWYHLPLELDAAILQGVAVTGLVFLIP